MHRKQREAQQRLHRIIKRNIARWRCKRCHGIVRVEPGHGDEVPAEYQGWYWCSCGDADEHKAFVRRWAAYLRAQGHRVMSV